MRKISRTLILLLILVSIIYVFQERLQNNLVPNFNNLVDNVKAQIAPEIPCAEPIPYSLGTFDPQFNISKEDFLSALAEAQAVWEKPYGKQLFVYAPDNTADTVLKINLVYDYRQRATKQLSNLGIVVGDDRASYDALKAKFDALKASYENNKNVFNARVESFKQKNQAYQDQVQSWNAKGGAPQAIYDKLSATRVALENESKQIEALQTNLNTEANEINALVVALNRLINTLNLSVDKYNSTNVSRGETFEEGLYSTDGINREINIYEFSNHEKLVRVLAHELGHALGLDHVNDPKAIMYKFNQGASATLSKTDLDALKIHCEAK